MNHLLWILDFILAAIFSFNAAWLLYDHFRKNKARKGAIEFVEDNFQDGGRK